MNPRMISPWKRSNSANYSFRLAIPARYRTRVGQSDIKLSLQTADIREARRLCGLLQGDWLAKFQAFDVADRIGAERTGADLVDRFFEVGAERNGGLDAVMNYEVDRLQQRPLRIGQIAWQSQSAARMKGASGISPHR